MTLVVGLTGGIGSGKSIVADAFASRGVDLTDADRLAHALTAPGEPGHSAVLAAFGPLFRLTDGTIDRARLRQLVFTHAVDAKTSGARIENDAACAVSASGAESPTIANTHDSE